MGSQGKNTEVVCHSLLQFIRTLLMTHPSWVAPYGMTHSFIDIIHIAIYIISKLYIGTLKIEKYSLNSIRSSCGIPVCQKKKKKKNPKRINLYSKRMNLNIPQCWNNAAVPKNQHLVNFSSLINSVISIPVTPIHTFSQQQTISSTSLYPHICQAQPQYIKK